MKVFCVFVLASLVGATSATIQIPPGCYSFSTVLNGLHTFHLPNGFTIQPTIPRLFGKRFILDQPLNFNINWSLVFNASTQLVLQSVKPTLPLSKEISHTCRIGIRTTSQRDLDFIREMEKLFKVCVMCDKFDTNTTTCETVGFCPKTSVCYRGYSDDRKYWPKTSDFNIFDATHPEAIYHGCCLTSDSRCRNHRYVVYNKNNKHLKAANYTIHTCTSFACNGDDRTSVNSLIRKINKVDGNWATWGHWGKCTVTCGTGTRTRHRSCTNPAPSNGGKNCIGTSSSTGSCPGLSACPVDGHWSGWQTWGSCSVTCGSGKQTRSRSCSNPPPAHGGKTCVGEHSQSLQCGQPCFIDGHWSTWSRWGHCSATCGSGTKTRHRTCTNPAPAAGGKNCVGSSSTQTPCSASVSCPVDGHWSSWSHWGHCSVTCGSGTKKRHRSCTNPTPSAGGKSCDGLTDSTRSCTAAVSCPIDGQWTKWSHWGHCSVTCGDGTKSRQRTCTNPAPSGGGKSCIGGSVADTSCSTAVPCPIDGHWSTWGQWGHCSVTCGSGTKTRQRTCNNPAPSAGGKSCSGSADTSTACSALVSCPIDGLWAAWGHWGQCSVTCGNGTKIRHRTCSNPAPSGGGQSCSGSSSKTIDCSTGLSCPVDGHWSDWQTWGSCSVTCGSGKQTRSRSCSNPTPAHGGKTCGGDQSQSRQCGQPCKIDGVWSGWQHWSKCSKSCSAGTRSRVRTCSNPAPAHGGIDCVGRNSVTENCDNGPCPEWSRWFYDACSVTCGSGTTMRLRHCSSGTDSDCGTEKPMERVTCSEKTCPVNGLWGTWGQWSQCSSTCGEGRHSRSRLCDRPAPQYGGADCSGNREQTSTCQIQECPHWLPFEEVSACSVTCGKGFIQLKRKCSTGIQSDCEGSAFNEKTCILEECV